MDVHKITICGGGNGAQAMAPIVANNLECLVDIYAPFGDEAEKLRQGIAKHGGLEVYGAVRTRARPYRVSNEPIEVIPGSELVVLVVPAFAHESTLEQIVPFLSNGAWVGAVPARGGFDYCASQILERFARHDVGLFGLQTLPWACRIQEYGQLVHVLGAKNTVDAACRPAVGIDQIAPLLQKMLGMPIGPAASLLALTLANTGQLIHPGIMYGLFSGWEGSPFGADEIPLFYHGLTECGAETLSGLSDEIQAIRARLEHLLDLSAVRPLVEWLLLSYRGSIDDPSSLRSAFTTNKAYAGLTAPMQELAAGQFVPNYHARYLLEDVPLGLAVSRSIAQLAGVPTPTMDRVIGWAGEQVGKDWLGNDVLEVRSPQRYGLSSLEALVQYTLGDGNHAD